VGYRPEKGAGNETTASIKKKAEMEKEMRKGRKKKGRKKKGN